MAAGESGIFSRPVAVDEFATRKFRDNLDDVPYRENVTTRKQLPHAAQILQPLVHHSVEQACCQPQRSHTLFSDDLSQFLNREYAITGYHQPCPIQETSPNLERGSVECQWRVLKLSLIHISEPTRL